MVPDAMYPPISSPITTVPVVFGYSRLGLSNIAKTVGLLFPTRASSLSPPHRPGCGKLITHPTPRAPFSIICSCRFANSVLGKGHPICRSTSSSVMFMTTKFPDSSGTLTNASNQRNLIISTGVHCKSKGTSKTSVVIESFFMTPDLCV